MLEEMRELGFERVELSHGIRIELAPGILRAIDDGVVSVSSVHNFCPLPGSVRQAAPNLFEPSDRRKSGRALWRLHSERTLEFAARVGARDVVLHSGSVSFRFGDPLKALESDPPAEGTAREKALSRLRRGASRAMKRVHQSYAELLPAASRLGLVLAVENREGVRELPLDDAFDEFFGKFPEDAPIGYWHDTGHARIKQLGGFLEHETHLAARFRRLVGFHLHDVDEQGRDHRAPGTGLVDFTMVARYVRPYHTLVFEPHPGLTPDEIRRSREFLLETLGGCKTSGDQA